MKHPQTKVKRLESYDCLSVTITYPTGGRIKYKINRSGEMIEVSFSNDKAILKTQVALIRGWIDEMTCNNGERVNAIQQHFEQFSSGSQAVEALKQKLQNDTVSKLKQAGITK